MMALQSSHKLGFVLIMVSLTMISTSVVVMGLQRPRPNPNQAAAFARWLVSENDLCILTIVDMDETLLGDVVPYTDRGSGIPYFYLARSLYPTGANARLNLEASFTITEKELGLCGTKDPQSPICAKLSFSGKLISTYENETETILSENALFLSHPQLSEWPKRTMDFQVFKFVPTNIFLVNDFKPPKKLTVEEYLAFKFV